MNLKRTLFPIAAASAISFLAGCGNNEQADSAEESASASQADAPASASPTASEGQVASMETADQKISYAMGYQMADRFANDPVLKLDEELMIQGVRDALAGKDMAVSQEAAQAAGMELQQRAQTQQAEAGEKAKAAGATFLEENKAKPDVVTTESGLQYKVLEEGGSEESPEATDTVKVHYHGTLVDGTVFDSSVERGEPVSFPLNGVIPGWTEGLQHMTVGDKYRFFIPSDLGYGARGAGSIPPNSVLIFDVELLGINES